MADADDDSASPEGPDDPEAASDELEEVWLAESEDVAAGAQALRRSEKTRTQAVVLSRRRSIEIPSFQSDIGERCHANYKKSWQECKERRIAEKERRLTMRTLYIGKILTMAQPQYAQAVLVEDGVIRGVGDARELKQAAGECKEVDLRGGTLLPGFIDAHSHFSQMAYACLQASLDGTQSVEEIGRRVEAFLRETKPAPGTWVQARDYDHNQLPGGKHPTLEQLDAMAPGYPLVIHHKSGHMGLMNTMALETLGITPETPVPEGGRIEVKEGKLTGYLEENAFVACLKQIPSPDPKDLLEVFGKAQEKYAAHGITTMQDGMVVKEMFPLYHMLLEQKLLKLDLVAYPSPDCYEKAMEEFGSLPPQAHLKIGGIKIFLDGSPQGRTAWMRTPYVGTEHDCGYGTMTDEAVREAMEFACRKKTQILCHCNGDAAAEQFLRCLEQVEQTHPEMASLRPVLIHGQLLGLDQLERVKRLGAVVSFFVAHVYHWGDVHIRNFGQERAAQISPVGSALAWDIPVTFHQDAPVIQPDMLETVWCAANRITRQGVVLGAKEAVSVQQALRAVTETAAYQYFREGQIGTIEPGKQADFVLLDRDPLETPRQALREIQVLETYKGGQQIWSKA